MNYTRRLTISLTQEEVEALRNLAELQRRDTRSQAAACVRECQEWRGLLPRLFEPIEPALDGSRPLVEVGLEQ